MVRAFCFLSPASVERLNLSYTNWRWMVSMRLVTLLFSVFTLMFVALTAVGVKHVSPENEGTWLWAMIMVLVLISVSKEIA